MKIQNKILVGYITGLYFFLCSFHSWSVDLTQYVKNGDAFFEQGDYKHALEEYDTGLTFDENSYMILWRMARYYGRLGVLSGDKKGMKNYTLKAEKFARKAISVNPQGFEGHLHLAESLGKLLVHAPFNKVYKHINEIRESCKKAIELNPKHAKAYLILGMWHRKVARASWVQKALIRTFFGKVPQADLATSIYLLQKAVELDDTRVKNHYELALSYDVTGDYKSAASLFKKAIKCKPLHRWDKKMIDSAGKYLKKTQYIGL